MAYIIKKYYFSIFIMFDFYSSDHSIAIALLSSKAFQVFFNVNDNNN